MKKLCILIAAVAVVFGMSLSAQAALVSITFEEDGILAGDIDGDRYDGTQITDQYVSYGVIWTDLVPSNDNFTGQGVTLPAEFNGVWYDSDPFLYYYGSEPVTYISGFTAVISLIGSADYFSFQYRRPNRGLTLTLEFYYDGELLSTEYLTWTQVDENNVASDWATYESTEDILFDQLVLTGTDKWCTDNYKFNMVPIPASLWLFATGLIPMLRFARNRKIQ